MLDAVVLANDLYVKLSSLNLLQIFCSTESFQIKPQCRHSFYLLFSLKGLRSPCKDGSPEYAQYE